MAKKRSSRRDDNRGSNADEKPAVGTGRGLGAFRDEKERARVRDWQDQFGRMLREARIAKELSVQVLAAKAGMNPQTIYRYETGTMHPALYFVCRLAKALGVPVDEIAPEVK